MCKTDILKSKKSKLQKDVQNYPNSPCVKKGQKMKTIEHFLLF